ncbi:MAG: hypothetical protein BroJett005_29640 [Ignavibacteriota bacterium]|nr:MAG: hypothetical protein BroJett005_29640 [Ignavibacteriota bacterium]
MVTIVAVLAGIRPLAALAVELHCPCRDDADQPPPGGGAVPYHYTIRFKTGCAPVAILRAGAGHGKTG